ncbi:MAG TPA: chemotaxis protein CheW [Solimonas sp.]|nr:chemotaxis protein CheW [Solimonas sp.]
MHALSTFLLFQLGKERYALDVRQIAEVLPLVTLKEIPKAPKGVAGVFDYRGAPVPVIDLSELMLGRKAQERLSTRIVLVHYKAAGGPDRLLGLIAERATDTIRRAAQDFVESGVANDAAPFLGPVCTDPGGFIQWIEVDKLLPYSVRSVLFRRTADI